MNILLFSIGWYIIGIISLFFLFKILTFLNKEEIEVSLFEVLIGPILWPVILICHLVFIIGDRWYETIFTFSKNKK